MQLKQLEERCSIRIRTHVVYTYVVYTCVLYIYVAYTCVVYTEVGKFAAGGQLYQAGY